MTRDEVTSKEVRSAATFGGRPGDPYYYRYQLDRVWGEFRSPSWVLWIMLNPSTADGVYDDATVRKCAGFSRRWGAHGFRIVNLFARVSTKPSELRRCDDPIGPLGVEYLMDAAHRVWRRVVVAWGTEEMPPQHREWHKRVVEMFGYPGLHTGTRRTLYCLGVTQNGSPKHPSRLAYRTELEAYPFL